MSSIPTGRSRAAARRGVTFLEVVFSAVILSIAAGAITGGFALIERLSLRDDARVAAYEVAHRLILQYMDDPESLPPDHLPLEMGRFRFRYTFGQEALLEDQSGEERLERREGRNVNELDMASRLRGRLMLLTVQVNWVRGDGFVDEVATLKRVFDPFADITDSTTMLKHVKEAAKDNPELQVLIENMLKAEEQKRQQEAFEKSLRGGNGGGR
ncbi:MAG: type II secretion system protein [Phycisphaerales bacterium]